MRRRDLVKRRAEGERGMSLIELMIALAVLVIGLLGIMGLLLTAVSGNNRNKTDTGGTFVSQVFMENILSQPGGGTVTVKDCANNTFTVSTAGPTTAGTSYGASLSTDGTIDFSQAVSGVTTGYKATYVSCGAGKTQTEYDVRWNVQTIDAFSRQITVAAQHKSGNTGQLFTKPASLRSILTNN